MSKTCSVKRFYWHESELQNFVAEADDSTDPGLSVGAHSACKTWHGFCLGGKNIRIIQSHFTAIPLVKTLGFNNANNVSYNF